MIWLSNGSVQVNFPDCCVLIQNKIDVPRPPKLRKAFSENYQEQNKASSTAQQQYFDGTIETFKMAIFSQKNPQTPQVFNYSPEAEAAGDPQLFNLDSLPKEGLRAINVLHEAHTIAITRQKKRNLSPDFTKGKGGTAGSANSSGSKKAKSSPTLRHLKDTKLALQEKAKFYEQQRLHHQQSQSSRDVSPEV